MKSNRPQNGDHLPLADFLTAMEEIGVAPPEYRYGYRAGYMDEPPLVWTSMWTDDQLIAYKRGRRAGRAANARGAHGRTR